MTIGRLIDVSSAQHPTNQPINWTAVANAGVTGVFVKATEGTTYTNPWMQRDVLGAQKAGLQVCCYHFADMGDPAAECNYFLRMAGRFARILDFETNTNVEWARTFLETLGLPATECMIYGSASSLSSFYQQLPAMAWVAAYGQLYPGWGVCWQFTDAATIPGIPVACDEDSWHGSPDQYAALFPNANPPEPEEAENVITWTTGTGATELTHISGVVNNVAYHWWQPPGGNGGKGPNGSQWYVEQLPS